MEPITVRLDADLLAALESGADAKGFESRSEYIRHLLATHPTLDSSAPGERLDRLEAAFVLHLATHSQVVVQQSRRRPRAVARWTTTGHGRHTSPARDHTDRRRDMHGTVAADAATGAAENDQPASTAEGAATNSTGDESSTHRPVVADEPSDDTNSAAAGGDDQQTVPTDDADTPASTTDAESTDMSRASEAVDAAESTDPSQPSEAPENDVTADETHASLHDFVHDVDADAEGDDAAGETDPNP